MISGCSKKSNLGSADENLWPWKTFKASLSYGNPLKRGQGQKRQGRSLSFEKKQVFFFFEFHRALLGKTEGHISICLPTKHLNCYCSEIPGDLLHDLHWSLKRVWPGKLKASFLKQRQYYLQFTFTLEVKITLEFITKPNLLFLLKCLCYIVSLFWWLLVLNFLVYTMSSSLRLFLSKWFLT